MNLKIVFFNTILQVVNVIFFLSSFIYFMQSDCEQSIWTKLRSFTFLSTQLVRNEWGV